MSNDTPSVESQLVGWMCRWASAIRSEHERELTDAEWSRIQDAAKEKFNTHMEESDNNE